MLRCSRTSAAPARPAASLVRAATPATVPKLNAQRNYAGMSLAAPARRAAVSPMALPRSHAPLTVFPRMQPLQLPRNFAIRSISSAAPPASISPKELRIKKIKWRSRTRGMKETNLLLGTYALANADKFTDSELDQFEALLEARTRHSPHSHRLIGMQENDPDLHNWILGSREAPPQYNHALLHRLQEHARNGLHNASLDVHIQTLS